LNRPLRFFPTTKKPGAQILGRWWWGSARCSTNFEKKIVGIGAYLNSRMIREVAEPQYPWLISDISNNRIT